MLVGLEAQTQSSLIGPIDGPTTLWAGPNPSCVGWDEMGSNPPFAQPGGGRFMVRIIASK